MEPPTAINTSPQTTRPKPPRAFCIGGKSCHREPSRERQTPVGIGMPSSPQPPERVHIVRNSPGHSTVDGVSDSKVDGVSTIDGIGERRQWGRVKASTVRTMGGNVAVVRVP